LRTGFEHFGGWLMRQSGAGDFEFLLRTVPGLLQELAVNSENNQPRTPSKTVSKESVGKATSELNNLLQIISGASAEIANMSEGKEGSEQYLGMLRSSISRAEAVAAELAEEAGPGYELAFFQLLKERIQPAFCERAASLDIYGLHTCVRHLQSVKTWSRGCSLLRNEIVNFLRAHLERVDAKTDIQLTIR